MTASEININKIKSIADKYIKLYLGIICLIHRDKGGFSASCRMVAFDDSKEADRYMRLYSWLFVFLITVYK